ncbi:glycosyltransferase family 4 protein [Chromobacterium violaceum]|nr:glycosyltransferase family 4 protein [Chromobacterium violaceum]OLZ77883.1 glycosyltransferase WbuB [Chromobacterium violaceum]
MRLVLIADTFPPLRSSGAVQLRDLSCEIIKQGYDIVVMIPSSELTQPWEAETVHGVSVLRLLAPKTKDISYFKRTINEMLMPFFMIRNLRKSPYKNYKFDGVVWYSPSIFLSPLVHYLKGKNCCKSYLILRDIFPDWAVDMGLMRKGIIYWVLKCIAAYQYKVADIIGVQSKGNLSYFSHLTSKHKKCLQILQNWIADTPVGACSINISNTSLSGRFIFVYAGNMGVAQNVEIFLDLAQRLNERNDIGFVFVGRGSSYQILLEKSKTLDLKNTLFFNEIKPDEITGLYSQCNIGLVSLDSRHKSHNIPGKFISYMQSGMPVLASINEGNDLATLIDKNKVGKVSINDRNAVSNLESLAIDLIRMVQSDPHIKTRCKNLYEELFSPAITVKQITESFKDDQ